MPSSPNYKRNYKQENSNDSPLRKKKRAMRNKARRIAKKAGLVKIGLAQVQATFICQFILKNFQRISLLALLLA